jgi:hypothetical protein
VGASGWVGWTGEGQGDVVVGHLYAVHVHVNRSSNLNIIFWFTLSVVYHLECPLKLVHALRPACSALHCLLLVGCRIDEVNISSNSPSQLAGLLKDVPEFKCEPKPCNGPSTLYLEQLISHHVPRPSLAPFPTDPQSASGVR